MSSKWVYLFLEAFCMWNKDCKNKKIKTFAWKPEGEGGFGIDKKGQIINNPCYNPTPRPKWCKKKFKGSKERVPEMWCLCGPNGIKCPFFAYTEADKEDKELFNLAWHIKTETCQNNKGELDKKKFKKLLHNISLLKTVEGNENVSEGIKSRTKEC